MIASASGFSIGSTDAIDERLVLTKAQMLSANDNIFPQVYFAICSDDGNLYIYNKSNTASETTGKFVKFGGLTDLPTTETVTKLNSMMVNQDGTWKEATLENAIKGVSQSSLTGNTGLPVNDITIYNAMGSAGGFATLDTNGRIPNSQLPTSASQIVGYFDSENEHELPDISSYNPGNILIVISNGYYLASTTMTLDAGKTLTTFEANQANLLIAAGYVFTLTDSDGTSLGTVSTFATNKVTLTDTTEIDLPYTKDLTATSTPTTVQITTLVGDEIMNIDSHWVHLSNTSSVSSVNGKTGAVVLSASDVSAVATNQGTENAGKGLIVGDDGVVKTGTVASGWNGTQAEWEALTDDEKAEYDGQLIGITDDYESSTFPLYDNLESFIDTTQNNVYVFGAFNNGEDYGGPLTRMSFGKVQVQIASSSVIRCIQTLDYSTNSERALTYTRTGIYTDGAWVWGKWCCGNNVYSETEETIVGTWIDGKPIYRKVIYIESMPNTTTLMQAHGIAIDNIVSFTAEYSYQGTSASSLPLIKGFSTTGNIFTNIDSTNVNITTDSDRSEFSFYGIVEYTKTTDE